MTDSQYCAHFYGKLSSGTLVSRTVWCTMHFVCVWTQDFKQEPNSKVEDFCLRSGRCPSWE